MATARDEWHDLALVGGAAGVASLCLVAAWHQLELDDRTAAIALAVVALLISFGGTAFALFKLSRTR